MKIYLAARWESRISMQSFATALRQEGHEIVSFWHEGESNQPLSVPDTPEKCIEEAIKNFNAITNCDVLILYTMSGNGSQGAQVEFGYALGLRKRAIIFGKPINIFNYLAVVCKNWNELRMELKKCDR